MPTGSSASNRLLTNTEQSDAEGMDMVRSWPYMCYVHLCDPFGSTREGSLVPDREPQISADDGVDSTSPE